MAMLSGRMPAFSFSASTGEALVLGLATGPVCIASCGPVVLPWMLAQPKGMRTHGRQLGLFLASRLVGYLLFASAVWLLGAAIPRSWFGRSWIAGAIQVLLAVCLLVFAAGVPLTWCFMRKQRPRLISIGEPPPKRSGALVLGFLTGINLCPPFLVAGVRAAQLGSLAAALIFFTCFFAGTALWFIPLLLFGFVQRTPAMTVVARLTAALLACWYLFSGASILLERAIYA